MTDLFSLSGRLPVFDGRDLAALLVMFGFSAGSGVSEGLSPAQALSALLEPAQELAHQQLEARRVHGVELLGAEFKGFNRHLKAAGAASVSNVNRFVLERTARSLRGAAQSDAVRRTASAIINESNRFGFDPMFVLAVIENESRFKNDAVGTHGEIGLMQIRAETARWISEKLKLAMWTGKDSLYEPEVNIRIGVAYLSFLRKRFDSDKDLYMAAYNMGTANVLRHLKESVRPDEYARRTLKHYRKIYGEWNHRRPSLATAGMGSVRPVRLAAL